jgi:hypothetical protein
MTLHLLTETPMFSLMIACAVGAPAPLPKPPRPLLPKPPPFTRGMPFDGQPGEWGFAWIRMLEFNGVGKRFRGTMIGSVAATLGRDHSWKAEPGGWRGGWEWNAKTRTLSVGEVSKKGVRRRWKATFTKGYGAWGRGGPYAGKATGTMWVHLVPVVP